MLIRSELRSCPHCGAPYLFNPPFPVKRRCVVCGKLISVDPYGIKDTASFKVVKAFYKALKKAVSDTPPQYFWA